MIPFLDQCRTAPESQLCKNGTALTNEILNSAIRALSDRELKSFEDELSFYAQTGLVGIVMSRLLTMLRMDAEATAA